MACCGEMKEARENKTYLSIIMEQLTAFLGVLQEADWQHVAVAYEPVWAIGTGLTASPAEAQEVRSQCWRLPVTCPPSRAL